MRACVKDSLFQQILVDFIKGFYFSPHNDTYHVDALDISDNTMVTIETIHLILEYCHLS